MKTYECYNQQYIKLYKHFCSNIAPRATEKEMPMYLINCRPYILNSTYKNVMNGSLSQEMMLTVVT